MRNKKRPRQQAGGDASVKMKKKETRNEHQEGNTDFPKLTKAMDEGIKWLQDSATVEMHLKKFDLIDLLEKSDGLIRIENFLPDFVADACLRIVKELPTSRWSVRQNIDNPAANTTQHKFFVANPRKQSEDPNDPLALLTNLLHALLPEKRAYFSAARYDAGNHITSHDDHAHVHHSMPDGSDPKPIFCSRDIAVILYLTKDWTEKDGGVLIDEATSKQYIPLFNSLVSFVVPRFHEVTAVIPRKGRDPRFSIFGWFLAEGDLYKYVQEEAEGSKGDNAVVSDQGRNRDSKKRKKRRGKKR